MISQMNSQPIILANVGFFQHFAVSRAGKQMFGFILLFRNNNGNGFAFEQSFDSF